VAECYSYPDWQKEDTEPKDRRDRILIFEDTDGDGRFDKRTVFADHLINLSGIEIGMGGAGALARDSTRARARISRANAGDAGLRSV
jgi:hypothetical protein